MDSRRTQKHHTLAFCFIPPLGKGLWVPIDNSEMSRHCRCFAKKPNRDRYAVYPATDDGNGDVAVGQTAVSR